MSYITEGERTHEYMDWIQKILEDKEQCEALSSFLRQYDVPDLGRALQLYREMHQVYMCRTKHSISKINIYDIILENDVRIHMSRKYTREVIIAYSQIRLKS